MEEYFENGLFPKPYISAVIVAAGSSSRMGGEDKIFASLNGFPVIVRSMASFQLCEDIDEIVVVTKESSVEKIKALGERYHITKLSSVVTGGAIRAESVKKGVEAVNEKAEFIAIHDGARPLVLPEEISRCVGDAVHFGGAILALPVTDTIKYAKKNSFVEYTPAREKLFAAQTPQIFRLETYKAAMEKAFKDLSDWTDDAAVYENYAEKVYLSVGSRENIKITTPTDILIAEAILKGREAE